MEEKIMAVKLASLQVTQVTQVTHVMFLLAGGDLSWVENESSYMACSVCGTRCFVGTPHPQIAHCSDYCRATLLRKQDTMAGVTKRGRPSKVLSSQRSDVSPETLLNKAGFVEESGIIFIEKNR